MIHKLKWLRDDLSLYALIYWPISATTKPLPPAVMARVGAFNPLMFGMGITMIGPTILDYGTEEQ